MKTYRNRTFLRALITVLAVVMITVVSCKKDDDPSGPATELTITSISPTSGGEGTEVNINGTGFSTTAAENAVTLSGKACTVSVSTATLIKIKIPADGATGTINVTVGGKTVTGPTFTFIPAGPVLAIESIAPTTGPKNTEVVITGTSFSAAKENNAVTINGKVAEILNASTTKLTIKMPAGAGTGPIKVTVGDQSAQSAEFAFVYTTEVHLLAGSGDHDFADGTGAAAKFAQDYDVAVDADGNVYVADTDNHRIRKVTPAGVVTTLAGSGTAGFADGTGAEAQFTYPYGVATDGDGNVWVADTHNHRIRKITPEGVVTTIAGQGTNGFNDATGADAKFNYPTGIDVGSDGTVYIADKDNVRIRKMTPEGVVTTFAGSTGGYTEGNGTNAKFAQPYNVAVDANDNVYVSDASNHAIRKITPNGDVTTLAGGSQGGDNGTGSAAKFYYPYGVATDANGNVYVADTFNQQVRLITPDGVVTSYAGVSGVAGNDDGAPETAKFKYLTGVTVGANGWVYVADKDNNTVRVITID